jgi:catechol 2,3-dioxygenase-like lactoylglutathione lyase family enzyme
MTALNFHHVQLPFPVDKAAQVYQFYTEFFGLKNFAAPNASRFRFGLGGQWLDLTPSPDAAPVQTGHVALSVLDLPHLRHRLLQAGHALDETRALPGYRRFFINDPAGNRLEILEPEPDGAWAV